MSQADIATIIAHERGYRVLRDGTLVSPKGVSLKTKKNRGGYNEYCIYFNGKRIVFRIHRLCAYQKFGSALFSAECVRHLDGNRTNNAWDNIEIGSQKENMNDIPKESRQKKGENASRYTIKHHNVREVQEYRKQGHTYKEIMKKFKLTNESVVWRILNRKMIE